LKHDKTWRQFALTSPLQILGGLVLPAPPWFTPVVNHIWLLPTT